MDAIKSILPAEEGLLPKWLLLVRILHFFPGVLSQPQVSLTAALNSLQSYTNLTLTRRVYCSPSSAAQNQVTPLSARTFGTWTFTSAVVRFYAAYNISNAPVYALCFWTYGIAFVHFMSEWLMFRTTVWGKGLAGPAIVSTASMIWMWMQWDNYV